MHTLTSALTLVHSPLHRHTSAQIHTIIHTLSDTRTLVCSTHPHTKALAHTLFLHMGLTLRFPPLATPIPVLYQIPAEEGKEEPLPESSTPHPTPTPVTTGLYLPIRSLPVSGALQTSPSAHFTDPQTLITGMTSQGERPFVCGSPRTLPPPPHTN